MILTQEQILRVRQCENILHLTRAFLKAEGYLEVEVPELVVSTGACEVIATMFSVDYFGDLAFLRQTGQLYLEELVVSGIDRVYCEGESFRKEAKAGDGRHLCEFKLIEMEGKGLDLRDLIDVEIRTLRYVVQNLDTRLFTDENLERLYRETTGPMPCVTYREALAILEGMGISLQFGDDISRQAEQMLIEHFGKGGLAIINHPTEMKFFDMAVNRNDESVVDSCDFILKYSGETFGSSVRETDAGIMRARLHRAPMYGLLMERAQAFAEEQAYVRSYSPKKLKSEKQRLVDLIDKSFEGYLGLFQDNVIQRAGYGLGVARLYQYILGLTSIQDVIIFPVVRATFGGGAPEHLD